jgi:hypothetical protein
LPFLLALSVTWLSGRWFFWPPMARDLVLAFATHNPMALLYAAYAAAVLARELGPAQVRADAAILLLAVWLPVAAWEVARKIRAPDEETAYETWVLTAGLAHRRGAPAASLRRVRRGLLLRRPRGAARPVYPTVLGAALLVLAAFLRFRLSRPRAPRGCGSGGGVRGGRRGGAGRRAGDLAWVRLDLGRGVNGFTRAAVAWRDAPRAHAHPGAGGAGAGPRPAARGRRSEPSERGRREGRRARRAHRGRPAVPDGVVVTADACRAFLDAAGLSDAPAELARRVSRDAVADEGRWLAAVQDRIRAAPVPPALVEALRGALRGLAGATLAVRSSGTQEDLAGASFAGQYESVLGVRGEAALHDAVRTCVASLFGTRVAAYLRARGGASAELGMAVVVQRLVEADVAGVLFTVNPVTGREEETVIEAVFGPSEPLVSGRAAADHFVVHAGSQRVLERRIAGASATLSDAEASRSALGLGAQEHLGYPLDLEWCGSAAFALVQAPPCDSPALRRGARGVDHRRLPRRGRLIRRLLALHVVAVRARLRPLDAGVSAVSRAPPLRAPGEVVADVLRAALLERGRGEARRAPAPRLRGAELRPRPRDRAAVRRARADDARVRPLRRPRAAGARAAASRLSAEAPGERALPPRVLGPRCPLRAFGRGARRVDAATFAARFRTLVTSSLFETETSYFATIYNTSNAKLDSGRLRAREQRGGTSTTASSSAASGPSHLRPMRPPRDAPPIRAGGGAISDAEVAAFAALAAARPQGARHPGAALAG